MPWWAWFLLGMYTTPGLYCVVAALMMKEIGGLPEEGEEPPKPRPLWIKAVAIPVGVVAVLLLWPYVLWEESRPRPH